MLFMGSCYIFLSLQFLLSVFLCSPHGHRTYPRSPLHLLLAAANFPPAHKAVQGRFFLSLFLSYETYFYGFLLYLNIGRGSRTLSSSAMMAFIHSFVFV